MCPNETTISSRITKLRKAQIREILDLLNNDLDETEPKKHFSYLIEFFISSFKENPDFNLYVKKLELKDKIEKIEAEKELLNFQLEKYQLELDELNYKLENSSSQKQEELISPKLKRAFESLIGTCIQRKITEVNKIPLEMYTGVSQSFEVRRPDLIKLTKSDFEKEMNKQLDKISD